MTSRPRAVALTAGLGLVAASLAAGIAPAVANPGGTDLVISEVYGGGGNTGAPYRNDFVELYNPTSAPISASGLTITYFSSSGAAQGSHTLDCGTVPAGGYFLVEEAAGASTTAPLLPDPDGNGTLGMSGTNGSIEVTRGSAVVDLVGYGTATRREGTAAPALTNTTSASRTVTRTQPDTDDNATDLGTGAPSPQNDGVARCTPGDEEPPPGGTEATIAEIQGTGATSDMVGDSVTTEGVVTAAYPTGGLNGFFLQTAGTGGQVDLASHDASDGIFVYQGSGDEVTVSPGDHVEVTGTVDEYAGATQLEAFDPADITALEPTDPIAPVVSEWPATDAQKESLEGMLFTAAGDFTITDNYETSGFGELLLARGEGPLVQPTEVARPNSARAVQVAADNLARQIVLDDASSVSFGSNKQATPAYISNDQPFRVGATSSFDEPVVLTEGGNPTGPSYRFQPLQPVIGPANAESPYVVPNTRTASPDAAQIAGDGEPGVTVASFNVLNYFTTLGDADDDNVGDGGCTAFTDRDGDGNNVRGGCDQRGAWDPQDLDRQQSKIVSAINSLDADVVGLMEIENSAALGEQPDEAVETLVAALNAEAGAGTWAANPSSEELPPVEQMDVISNAIIYKPGAVERVGESRALGDQSSGNGTASDEPFANAREPLGQVFAPVGGGEPFLVVVNHFKSKGSAGPFPGDADSGDGQGAANESRTRQAEALAEWVSGIQGDVDDVLLLGDFNSYTQEDPLRVLYAAGYTNLGNDGEYSYSFDGRSGSLDHVLANPGALERYTGSDVWNINAVEPLPLEYSRWNYHGTDFHTDGPWRSSDHDPVVVGLEDGLLTPTVAVDARRKGTSSGTSQATVEVTGGDGVATGTVRFFVNGEQVGRRNLNNKGKASLRIGPFPQAGSYTLRVDYSGDDTYAPASGEDTFRVGS